MTPAKAWIQETNNAIQASMHAAKIGKVAMKRTSLPWKGAGSGCAVSWNFPRKVALLSGVLCDPAQHSLSRQDPQSPTAHCFCSSLPDKEPLSIEDLKVFQLKTISRVNKAAGRELRPAFPFQQTRMALFL
jgi:hypothetical protein